MTETTETTPTKRERGRPKGRTRRAKTKRIQTTIHFSPDLIERLDARVSLDGIPSRAELVRLACEAHLRRADKRAAREAK